MCRKWREPNPANKKLSPSHSQGLHWVASHRTTQLRMAYSNWVLVFSHNRNPERGSTGWYSSAMRPSGARALAFFLPSFQQVAFALIFVTLLSSTESKFQAGRREGLAKPTKSVFLKTFLEDPPSDLTVHLICQIYVT